MFRSSGFRARGEKSFDRFFSRAFLTVVEYVFVARLLPAN